MQAVVRTETTVLPGQRIEIAVPALVEGEIVEVLVFPRGKPSAGGPTLLEFIDSLPPGPRSHASWEELEREFQRERNAWER